MLATLWVSVSNRVCTTGAHLSCYMLGVLRMGVVVTIIEQMVVVIGAIAVIVDAGGSRQYQHHCTVVVLTC